jgi:tetratricopeptide (TPR) repeat protein
MIRRLALCLLLLGACGCGSQQRLDYELREARFELDAGNVNSAMRHLQAALDIRDDEPEALFLMGDCHRARGEYEKAVSCYDRCVQDIPQHMVRKVHQSLGKSHFILAAQKEKKLQARQLPGKEAEALAKEILDHLVASADNLGAAVDMGLPLRRELAQSLNRAAIYAYKGGQYKSAMEYVERMSSIGYKPNAAFLAKLQEALKKPAAPPRPPAPEKEKGA